MTSDLNFRLTLLALSVALGFLSVFCFGAVTAHPASSATIVKHASLNQPMPVQDTTQGGHGLSLITASLALSILFSVLLARALERRVRERTWALQEANQRLEVLANRDDLTQIYNRRYFQSRVQTEWRRAQRDRGRVAVILCDVDHFKLYNDAYGHPAGDNCLRQVAQVIQQCLKRPADIAARYGGEEFVILLPDTDLPGALTVAEQIRAGVAALTIPHRASATAPHVTLSLGVTSALPEKTETWDVLIAGADKGLYQSKHGGRNQVNALQAACAHVPQP